MKYKILLLSALVSMSTVLYADVLKGTVKDDKNETVIGANVWWLDTSNGTTTDVDGNFAIETVRSTNKLVVSYTGYQTDTITVSDLDTLLDVRLISGVELAEVVVANRRLGTITSRIDPLQTQTITSDELCRAACCNLAESFDTNASVDVTYSDAATGARQIRLLGLAGTYVQMMTEQFPNLQGAASAFGMSYVPGTWMESISVSKGTGSVKNGYEALTGQINVEYKKPQTAAPVSVNLFGAHTGRAEANVDANYNFNEKLSTGLLLHYSRDMSKHDSNDDGFIDLPTTEQFNGMNRWYYKSDRYIFQAMANVIHEKRESGQVEHLIDNPYRISINTNRGFFSTKNGYIINKEKNMSVAMLLSATYHDQQSRYGLRRYDVNQKNVYANLIFETEFTQAHKISTGLSYVYDGYDEDTKNLNVIGLDNLKLKRRENVAGGYFQYTYMPSDVFTLQAGLRADNHSEHGTFVTPRIHLKYSPFGDILNLRASAGKGYRVANILVENSYLLASNRVLRFAEDLNPFESAWNYGASAHLTIPLFSKPLSVIAEWYYTDFQNQIVADLETPKEVSFYNLDGRSYAQNTQVEVSYPFFRGFTLTGAFRWTDAKVTYDGVLMDKPLNNKYKGLLTASYQTRLKKWQFDVTTQFNGKGRMPNPGDLALWESEFPSYVSLNAQITKNFRTWSVYVGGENLTNYKQKNPIIGAVAGQPITDDFDATMIWGPIHGPKFYIGMRWSLPERN